MTQGTTPTLVFELDIEPGTLVSLYLTFRQGYGREVTRREDSITADNDAKTLTVTLTQEETLKFEEGGNVEIQLRAVTTTGAALASAIAFTFGGIGMAAVLWRHPLISPRGTSLRPDGTILRPCLKVALPCALQRFGTSFGYVAFASMINGLGTTAIAAHSIANTAESAFYIPGYGMQTAAATLSGNCYGARDPQRMKRLCRMMIALEVLLMALSGGTLFLSARVLMGLFTPDAAVIELGARVLRMVAVTEPVYGLAVILEGIFQGVGDTKSAFCFNLLGMWGVRILGTFIALRFFGGGLTAAWGCMIAHNLLLGALLLTRFLRGNWNPLKREINRGQEVAHGI